MKLATLLNFDVIEKINTGFRFRDPISNEINWSFVIHSFSAIGTIWSMVNGHFDKDMHSP